MVLEVALGDGVPFSKEDLKSVDKVREKYKHNRRIETDFHFLLIKEMVRQVHSRTSGFMERKLESAIIGLLLPDPQVQDEDRIERSRDGRNKPVL